VFEKSVWSRLQQINSLFQKQIQELVNTPTGSTTSQSYIANDSKALQTEINNLRKQLKMSKDEADKLRDQLTDRYSVAVISMWKPVSIYDMAHFMFLMFIYYRYKCYCGHNQSTDKQCSNTTYGHTLCCSYTLLYLRHRQEDNMKIARRWNVV